MRAYLIAFAKPDRISPTGHAEFRATVVAPSPDAAVAALRDQYHDETLDIISATQLVTAAVVDVRFEQYCPQRPREEAVA